MPTFVEGLIKNWITIFAGLSGIAGFSFSLIRSGIGYLNDRSWVQLASRNTDVAAQCIRDLNEAELRISHVETPELHLYSEVLTKRLELALQQLERLEQSKAAQARKRFEEPKGIVRCVLLYRPDGIAAWILHSLFYGILCLIAAVVVNAIRINREDNFIASAIFVGFVGALALVPRSVALRRKRFVILGKDQPDPNRDLNWRQVVILAFRVSDMPSRIERFLYYLCLLFAFLGLLDYLRMVANLENFKDLFINENYERLIGLLLLTLLGWMLRYDVLLRRALAKLAVKHSEGESTLNSGSAVSTVVVVRCA